MVGLYNFLFHAGDIFSDRFLPCICWKGTENNLQVSSNVISLLYVLGLGLVFMMVISIFAGLYHAFAGKGQKKNNVQVSNSVIQLSLC